MRRWLPLAVLGAALSLTYWNSLRSPFLFDDAGAVLNNPTIRHLWSVAVLNPPSDGSTTTGRPIVNLSFALNYAISGERVWSYHLLNVVLHGLAALTLFGLARHTLSALPSPLDGVAEPRAGRVFQPAFFIALLWALHPLQTETVVGIAQRTELLCSLFYLFTLYAFVRAVVPRGDGPVAVLAATRVRRLWLALSVVSCLAGMASKEIMVTAPLLVLLYDRTFVSGGFCAALRQRLGYYAALAGTWLLLGALVWQSGATRGASAGFGLGVSGSSYLLKQCEALVLYLKLSLWPHPLVLDYGTAVGSSAAGVWWQRPVVLALLGGTLWALRRKPVLGFAGAWFFLILAPSSSIVPLVTQTMAEHRMYLALAAFVGLLVLAVHLRLGPGMAWPLAGLALAFGAVSALRNRDYRDGLAIWSANVAAFPSSARAHNNLALALQARGDLAGANEHFDRAIALQPNYVTGHYDWGVVLLEQGRAAEAVTQLEIAVQLAPDHVDALVNLGNALVGSHRAVAAIPRYEQALGIDPTAADVHYDLGVALAGVGRPQAADAQLHAALALQPNLPDARYQLGRIAEQTGRPAEAESQYAEALRLAPGHLAAHRQLGLLLARSGQLPAAAEHFRAILVARPADADAHANLGNVLLVQGDPRGALTQYETALRLKPDDARIRESIRLAREALP